MEFASALYSYRENQERTRTTLFDNSSTRERSLLVLAAISLHLSFPFTYVSIIISYGPERNLEFSDLNSSGILMWSFLNRRKYSDLNLVQSILSSRSSGPFARDAEASLLDGPLVKKEMSVTLLSRRPRLLQICIISAYIKHTLEGIEDHGTCHSML
jgi:hypothetical protein